METLHFSKIKLFYEKFQNPIKLFLLTLLAVICMILFLYYPAEQGIFRNNHLPLGLLIWAGEGYQPTYPIWGYPAFVGLIATIFPNIYLLVIPIIQVAFSLISIVWVTNVKVPIWSIFLFFPIFAHATVKWPDSLYVTCLIIIFGAISKKKYYLLFVFSIIAANLRPDFLYLIIVIFALSFLFKIPSLKLISFSLLIFAFLALLPWHLHSGSFSSSNGGLVAYITLGQLPDNPWNREHRDEEGFAFTGSISPVSVEGDSLLRKEAVSDILNYPLDYGKKVLYNFVSALFGGIFGFNFPFLVLIFLLYIVMFKKGLLDSFTLSIVIFSLLWVSLLQYQPRHLNLSYTLVLLCFLKSNLQKSNNGMSN